MCPVKNLPLERDSSPSELSRSRYCEVLTEYSILFADACEDFNILGICRRGTALRSKRHASLLSTVGQHGQVQAHMIARESDPNQFFNCIQTEHILFLQTMDPILHTGEPWLNLGDIRVSKSTQILTLILVEMHRGQHTSIHKYSLNRFVNKNLPVEAGQVFRSRSWRPSAQTPNILTIRKSCGRPNFRWWFVRSVLL